MTKEEKQEKAYYDWLKTNVDSKALTKKEWDAVGLLFAVLNGEYVEYINELSNPTSFSFDKQQKILKTIAKETQNDELSVSDVLWIYATISRIYDMCENKTYEMLDVQMCSVIDVEASKFVEKWLGAYKENDNPEPNFFIPISHNYDNKEFLKRLESVVYKLRSSSEDDVNKIMPKPSKDAMDFILANINGDKRYD